MKYYGQEVEVLASKMVRLRALREVPDHNGGYCWVRHEHPEVDVQALTLRMGTATLHVYSDDPGWTAKRLRHLGVTRLRMTVEEDRLEWERATVAYVRDLLEHPEWFDLKGRTPEECIELLGYKIVQRVEKRRMSRKIVGPKGGEHGWENAEVEDVYETCVDSKGKMLVCPDPRYYGGDMPVIHRKIADGVAYARVEARKKRIA